MLNVNQIGVGDMLTDKVEIGGLLFGGNMSVVSINETEVTVRILNYYERGKKIRISHNDSYPTLYLHDPRKRECYVHLRKYDDMLNGYEFSEENKNKLFEQ